MKTIGLISDTHGYLDDSVFRHFENCDEIWHAGDFGTIEIADQLNAFKPLRGVYGNIDGQDVRLQYPEHLRFDCEDLKVWITHIGGYPGRYSPGIREKIYQNPPGLFITGHSHILKVIYDKKISCLHLNPGAAGKQGWHKVRTLLRFCISGEKIHNLDVIELANR
ncbi:MAG: YfcE family phosphodiesterase [Sphingobacteriales bacterium 17-39-43]|uniref:metallophosphoesterase family protein n=1 Tax=Daejeonella sp. TaxID=2805397 RepID=UPI000BCA4927|nr:metallophosphoesterase family protein [Daejeonella sp.]MCF8452960.1 metallophosphatase family protein [Pedobacter sp.]OYZ33032.1 MAG: YfcE family phosphodiesterase [Sphingobacteriales bacterium 16-39-50]OZA26441.1 MAG: YfcE family phosphodiesterase [Sphingobacteriales bacterium 17-39-43]HQT21581.1 metallophosphoesterase family protein [Daejeonella sp.]HQT56312.1 metallophosphoesterase family protein [Daejeonella sp.]